MIIYYVCKESKLKGPYDITDANRRHIMGIGDVCIRETLNGVYFLIIQSSINKWTACKSCGVGNNKELEIKGNSLLFSFDGINKRFGEIKRLKAIIDCFSQDEIRTCIENAISILEYKSDYWELGVFTHLLSLSSDSVSFPQDSKNGGNQQVEKNYPTLFASYLPTEAKELFFNQLGAGYTLKESYTIVRKEYPSLYRSAMLRFLHDNPAKSIYD